jgi:regulator of replication initiation timing
MERFFKKEIVRLKNVCSDLFNTYQSLVDKFVKLNQENEQLKTENTELCERLEAVAKESGKALTRQIIAESMVADLQKEKVVWHDLRKKPNDLPKVDMLVRVRLSSGMEHICETDYYEPSEDEIGYGKLIISFYELNGKWIDDTEIIAWCEIPKFEVEE